MIYISNFWKSRTVLTSLIKSSQCIPCTKVKVKHVVCVGSFFKQQKRHIYPPGMQCPPSSQMNMPGQGLQKYRPTEEDENKSVVLRMINRRIKEQEEGDKVFHLLPDYKFLVKLVFVYGFLVLIIFYLLFPDLKHLILGKQEVALVSNTYEPVKVTAPLQKLYTLLPLRLLSRMLGRFLDMKLNSFVRGFIIGLFSKLIGANMDEAETSDLSKYKSLGHFFRRKIKSETRPVNSNANIVSPADGKMLTCGRINNGQVEQVKGVTYSLPSFLGPLDPTENIVEEQLARSQKHYFKNLMHDPVHNDLFQCVIYLGPGDYHGFHSPADWVVKTRRHFPGELLSVNPRIASWIKDLFVLNERVSLLGEWKHGFFSMTAVGATNVGNIRIHGDVLLHTNQTTWKAGTHYDFDFEDKHLTKGDRVGEFRLGSSIVLIFEAPKDFQFNLQDDQKLKYGEQLEEISQ